MYSLKTPGNCPTGFAFGMHDNYTYRAWQDKVGKWLSSIINCYPGGRDSRRVK